MTITQTNLILDAIEWDAPTGFPPEELYTKTTADQNPALYEFITTAAECIPDTKAWNTFVMAFEKFEKEKGGASLPSLAFLCAAYQQNLYVAPPFGSATACGSPVFSFSLQCARQTGQQHISIETKINQSPQFPDHVRQQIHSSSPLIISSLVLSPNPITI